MQYVVTMFDGGGVLAAFKLAGWSPANHPVDQMMKVFTDITGESLVRVYADFIQRLYREALSPETKCLITCALLDAFALKHGAEVKLLGLNRALPRVFGLNIIGANKFI